MDRLTLFGPPGTGKTTTLLAKMEQALASGLAPTDLAYLTFTVAARREAKQRAMAQFNYTAADLPYIRTIHSLCLEQLGLGRESLMVAEDQFTAFGNSMGYAFTPRQASEDGDGFMFSGTELGDKLLAFDHFRRHRRLDLETAYRHWPEPLPWFHVERFHRAYTAWKRKERIFDFTDLLEQPLRPLPVDTLFVDEAQDLSPLQWHALQQLERQATTHVAAGDDDQAIYEWAGASPYAMLDQQGAVQVLAQSYRLPRVVHRMATTIVDQIQRRQAKTWHPRDETGVLQWLPTFDRWTLPAEGSVLILYRQHRYRRTITDQLRSLGIPYTIHGLSSVSQVWTPALLAWEQYRRGTPIAADAIAQFSSAMTGGRMLVPGILQQPWFTALDRIPPSEVQYLRSVLRQFGTPGLVQPPRVRLSTIHGAKGEEADHVVLLTSMGATVWRGLDADPDPERRVWYVAVTRAKRTLTLVGDDNPLVPFL